MKEVMIIRCDEYESPFVAYWIIHTATMEISTIKHDLTTNTAPVPKRFMKQLIEMYIDQIVENDIDRVYYKLHGIEAVPEFKIVNSWRKPDD